MTLLLDEQNNLVVPDNSIDLVVPDDEVPPPIDESPRWGRNMLLGFGALGLIVTGTAAAIALPHLNDGTGDRTYHPTTFADVDHEYEFGIGSLKVDLRDVDFPSGTHVITVNHGIGSAQVFLPADVDYDVTGDLAAGDLDVLGETEDGFNNELNAQSVANATAIVIVDLEVDIGYGRVRQG